jgi:hypothetical protein
MNTMNLFEIYPQNQPIVQQIEKLVNQILSLAQCNTGISACGSNTYSCMKVTQAILPVEVKCTPMCESENTDKNVCATTDPLKQA